METTCQGENCTSTDGRNHSVECLFEHFMAYTSGHREPPEVQAKLKKAYFDGHEAGAAPLQWLPIETAPMDGETAVLGYQKTYGGMWVIAPMYFKAGTWRIVAFHLENTEFEMQPTHWMPIPPAPALRAERTPQPADPSAPTDAT